MTEPLRRIPVTEAAQRLEVSRERALRFLLRGLLSGEKTGGNWMVDESSIETLRKQRQAA